MSYFIGAGIFIAALAAVWFIAYGCSHVSHVVTNKVVAWWKG